MKDLVMPYLSVSPCEDTGVCMGGDVSSREKDSCLQGRKRDCLTALVTLSLLYKMPDESNLREEGLILSQSFIIHHDKESMVTGE